MEFSSNTWLPERAAADRTDMDQGMSTEAVTQSAAYSRAEGFRPSPGGEEMVLRPWRSDESQRELTHPNGPVTRRFSRDERVAAVRAAAAPMINATMIAQVLGIDPGRIHVWRQAMKRNELVAEDEAQARKIEGKLLRAASTVENRCRWQRKLLNQGNGKDSARPE